MMRRVRTCPCQLDTAAERIWRGFAEMHSDAVRFDTTGLEGHERLAALMFFRLWSRWQGVSLSQTVWS